MPVVGNARTKVTVGRGKERWKLSGKSERKNGISIGFVDGEMRQLRFPFPSSLRERRKGGHQLTVSRWRTPTSREAGDWGKLGGVKNEQPSRRPPRRAPEALARLLDAYQRSGLIQRQHVILRKYLQNDRTSLLGQVFDRWIPSLASRQVWGGPTPNVAVDLSFEMADH